jgi:hypothetical protein
MVPQLGAAEQAAAYALGQGALGVLSVTISSQPQ